MYLLPLRFSNWYISSLPAHASQIYGTTCAPSSTTTHSLILSRTTKANASTRQSRITSLLHYVTRIPRIPSNYASHFLTIYYLYITSHIPYVWPSLRHTYPYASPSLRHYPHHFSYTSTNKLTSSVILKLPHRTHLPVVCKGLRTQNQNS